VTISWRCPQCGLDYDFISPRDAALAVRTFPRRYRNVLTHFGPGEDVDDVIRRRPEPGMWSALEHTAHVAEVLDLMAPNIRQIASEANPRLPSVDPDRESEEQSYNEQPLLEVLSRLETACADLSMAIEYMDPSDWTRTGTFEYGQREAIDVVRNAVHEGAHHLRDIEWVLAQVRKRPPPDEADE
jgi:hypothetical protein